MSALDPDASTITAIARAALGVAPTAITPAGRGTTAAGSRIDAPGGPYCVLVGVPPPPRYHLDRPSFEARFALLEALHARDARCPRPIATDRSEGVPEALRATPWMVTTWIDGEPAPAHFPAAVASDLGALLRAMHALPAQGYGQLEDRRGLLRGREGEAGAGFLNRWWPELWPFDGRPLVAHPIVRVAPHFVGAVAGLREQLMRYAEASAVAVCHTDLNAQHILVRDGHLAGVIDFGDAAVVPPAFDLASVAYFFGWHALEPLLEAYEPNGVLHDVRRAEAHQLGIVLALQKIAKHVVLNTSVDHPTAFLAATLPLAGRRLDA